MSVSQYVSMSASMSKMSSLGELGTRSAFIAMYKLQKSIKNYDLYVTQKQQQYEGNCSLSNYGTKPHDFNIACLRYTKFNDVVSTRCSEHYCMQTTHRVSGHSLLKCVMVYEETNLAVSWPSSESWDSVSPADSSSPACH